MEFEPYYRMNAIKKTETMLQLLQATILFGCSIATIKMSGFDCDVVIFLLLVATKWCDIASSISSTCSLQHNRTLLKILIALFALSMAIYACTQLENHIDIVETFICYWQFAK